MEAPESAGGLVDRESCDQSVPSQAQVPAEKFCFPFTTLAPPNSTTCPLAGS